MNYKNALEILPRRLVEEIREHFSGGLLWVPAASDDHKERNRLIVALIEKGEPVADVAKLAQISERWAWELLRRSRRGREGAEEN